NALQAPRAEQKRVRPWSQRTMPQELPLSYPGSVHCPTDYRLPTTDYQLPTTNYRLRITLPPFITNFTRFSSVMSVSGFPDTAIRSANLPAAIEPTRSVQPIAAALLIVPA